MRAARPPPVAPATAARCATGSAAARSARLRGRGAPDERGHAVRQRAAGGARMTARRRRSPMHPARLSRRRPLPSAAASAADARGAARAARSGLAPCRFETVDARHLRRRGRRRRRRSALPAALARFDCRNNRAGAARPASRTASPRRSRAAPRALRRRRASACSSAPAPRASCETELAYRRRDPRDRRAARRTSTTRSTHNTYSLADFVRARLGTARARRWRCPPPARRAPRCSPRRARMIAAGLIDAAVVGGVDTLCLTTLYGFHSLRAAVAASPAGPFDARSRRHLDRRGGGVRAARARAAPVAARCVLLLGIGEIERRLPHVHAASRGAGRAAARCERALAAAGLAPGDDRLHQPARHRHAAATTPPRTARCMRAVRRRGARAARPRARPATRSARPASSRRSICALAHRSTACMPGSAEHARASIRRCASNYLLGEPRARRVRRVLSNSFGFGGTNCSLVLGRARLMRSRCVDGVACVGPGPARLGGERARCSRGAAALRARADRRCRRRARCPPAERRRTGAPVQARAGRGPRGRWPARASTRARSPTVFTSSSGDGDNVHEICETLAAADRQVSPTRFHNSVHNAPAGYWSIATRSRRALDQPVRLRRELRRRPARSARRRSLTRRRAGAADRLRRAAIPSRCDARASDPGRFGVALRARARRATAQRSRPRASQLHAAASGRRAGGRRARGAARRRSRRRAACRCCGARARRRRAAVVARLPRRQRACASRSLPCCIDARTGSRALIPHAGRDVPAATSVLRGTRRRIRVPQPQPPRSPTIRCARDGRLPALCGIEYAAQAMAVHGALIGAVAARQRRRAGLPRERARRALHAAPPRRPRRAT